MLHYRLHKDPRSSHQQIAKLLKERFGSPSATAPETARILDVGAAQGFLGRILEGSGLSIDAIEPNPHWADHARPFYRNVHASTVEPAHLSVGSYDAIVCADVLEHLMEPLAVLKQLRRIAKD